MKNYKFVFWGNINIHVYPLAKSLSKFADVSIIYDSKLFSNRTERKAIYEASSTLHLIDLNQNTESIESLIKHFSNSNVIHINSRLKDDGSFVHKALTLAHNMNEKIYSLPQEGFQFQGIKGIINYFKWMYYINFKYKNIKGFGLTGYNAFHDFKHIHCSSNRIFPFLYVTMPFDLEESNQDITTQSIRITFVGAIDERKNIKRIISFINRNKNLSLLIIN